MNKNKSAAARGGVSVSTLVLAVLAAFCAGLFAGQLVAGLTRDADLTQTVKREIKPQSDQSDQSDQLGRPVDHSNDPEFRRLEQAVRDNPKSAAAWASLGNWHFDHNMFEEAVRAYESSLIIKPGDPNVMTDLGIMYRALRQYEKALEFFAKAAAIAPDHLQSRFNQGVVLIHDLRREEEGMRVWAELARKAPDYSAPDGRKLADIVDGYYRGRPGAAKP